MWISLALLAALFTAITGTLSKAGLEKVGPVFGFAIQSTIITVLVWGIVLIQGNAAKEIASLEGKTLGIMALAAVASLIAFLCYFGALALGDSSRVQPIDRLSLIFAIAFGAMFLKEKASDQVIAGAALMAFGAVFIATAKTSK